jgi:parvulin-like peptidyl-prolyl isomerase
MPVLNRPALLLLVTAIFLCMFGSCDTSKNTEKVRMEEENRTDALASVNGIRIGDSDVANIMKGNANYRKATASMRKSVLEMIIRQELMYQKAVELGLDKHPDEYQEQVQRLEAQLYAFKRKVLSKRFRKQEVVDKTVIHEGEMRAYFNENSHKIQMEFHVGQISYRDDEEAINDDLNDIEKGALFEDVAEERFSELPKTLNMHPWDLGYLTWNQIPEAWQGVIYGMKKGETSGIIKGPEKRFSIIKLVDRRENPNSDFEKAKPLIGQILKERKMAELSKQWEKELRSEAEIIYYEQKEKGPTIEQ